MIDPDVPTQPIHWIRPRAPWYRRRGTWLLPVLLAVFATAALVDATTAHDEPTITAAVPMPTMVIPPPPVTAAARAAFLATVHRKVHDRDDDELLRWATAACGHLDRYPTKVGLMAALSALHNASGLDGYHTAYLVGAAVHTICPRHIQLINP